jgi:hypothetical protein
MSRLKGLPAPPEELVNRAIAIKNAIRDLHSAILPTLDAIRLQGSPGLTFREEIGGDAIAISIKPKTEEED